MNNSQSSKKISIKWKVFAILIIFIVISIFVIWFFQVKMLYTFYQAARFDELEVSAKEIINTETLGNSELLAQTVYHYADENHSSIYLFLIDNNVATPVITAKGAAGGITPFFSASDFQMLYENAINNGGTFVATATSGQISTGSNDKTAQMERISEYTGRVIFGNREKANAVSATVFSGVSGDYFLLQTSDLSPVAATVRTLNLQFLWIGVIIILLALVLAEIMHKLITTPIIKMNSSAQRFALGNYDVEFDGRGYKEIYELSQALDYASCELSKTNKLQKELISNVSHDLRTPLTMIKGYGEVMRDIPGENTPENVQVIIDEAERLSDLVNDMLDVSRLQSGTRKPNMHLFSLTQATKETMSRYEKLTEKDGYRVEFVNEDEKEVFVVADSVMILQVLYNLINNAINYTGDNKTVLVRQNIIGDKVRISVLDSGEGILPQDIPFIWDRYYKVDKVHKRATVGTGLGLSIVKEILELHGSQFGVNSVIGKGSTFWFELPIAE